MATTYVIDPMAIATDGFIVNDSYEGGPLLGSSGYRCGEPLTIATQGFIVRLLEEIVIVGGGGVDGIGGPKKQEKKKKKITAIVTINDVEYKDSVMFDDVNISLRDVKVEIKEGVKPTIKIILKEDT